MKRTRMTGKALAVLAAVGLAAGFAIGRPLFGERYEEKFAKTEALAKDGRVIISNISGPIVVKSWAQEQVQIDAVKTCNVSSAAKAKEMKINVVIAIADTGGQLVYLERFDVVQWGSNDVAIHKAKASVMYKRPTLALENAVKANITYLTLDGVSAIEGGVPIIENGKIIGAIGVSGGSAVQDGQCAKAGAAVIK